MCYSGKCNYENHMGDCMLYTPALPKDALCVVMEKELDRFEFKQKLDDAAMVGRLKKEVNDRLIIYNYTPMVQFTWSWDEITKMCRGLIVDINGNIVARPFPKFFNLGEAPETKLDEVLKLGIPEVTAKVDGSLGISYWQNGKFKISTRGSFVSEQANEANEILKMKYSSVPFEEYAEYTWLFEIIYPENRIVVNYGDTWDLYLLAMIHTATGEEKSVAEVQAIAKRFGFPVPESSMMSFEEVYAQIQKNEKNIEGFVLRFSNGLRVKIKTADYKRLHKLISGVSETDIWECLKNHTPMDELITDVPDELYNWISMVKHDLESEYRSIEMIAQHIWRDCPKFTTRKDYAAHFQKSTPNKKVHVILYNILSGYPYEESLWKMIKPESPRRFRTNNEA